MLIGQSKRKLFLYSAVFVFVLVGREGLLRSICLFGCLMFLGSEGYYIKTKYNGRFCWMVYLMLIVIGIASQTFFTHTIVYGSIVIFLMFLELLFLYLCYYPCTSPKSVAIGNWIEDIVFLGVWNTGNYFFGGKYTASKWSHQIKFVVASAVTGIVVVVMVALGVNADYVFALVVYCFFAFIEENLFLMLLVGLFGFCHSIILYNVLTGLAAGILQNNPHWYYHTQNTSKKNKDSFILDVLLNDKTIFAILCFVILLNLFLFLCRVIYFFQEDSFSQAFLYESQFYVLIIILGVEAITLYVIRIKLLIGISQSLDINWSLTLLSSISSGLLWIVAVIMYIFQIYTKLISLRRSVVGYVLALFILYFYVYGKSCKKTNRNINKGLITSRTIVFIFAVVFFWNSAIFPFYNVNLYEMKHNIQETELVLPEELDIGQMAKAGTYAVPVLIRLLAWEMPYGNNEKTVSMEAQEQLLQIYYQEMDKEKSKEIMALNEKERLEALLEFMEESIIYQIGFRGYCKQKLTKFLRQ